MTGERREAAQAVILAAGLGERIGSRVHGTPKPLVEVAGHPLIEYALAQSSAAGCREAIVVVGNSSAPLEEYLLRRGLPLPVRVVDNPDSHLPNGVSLLAAEELVTGPFYLQMADHLFAEPVLKHLPGAGDGGGRHYLLVDRNPVYSDETDTTKVRLRGRGILSIGKELDEYDAVDTGCFLLGREIFDALREVKNPRARSVTAGMRKLIETAGLEAVFLEDTAWVDVDTAVDREEAERLFGETGPYRG